MNRTVALPLTVAVMVFAGAAQAQTLVVKKISGEPAIDGNAEAMWQDAPATVVKVARIPEALVAKNKALQTGKYASNWEKSKYTEVAEVEMRALHNGDKIFLLATWKDSSKDDQHKPWVWQGSKADGEYLAGPEREDRIALSFPIKGEFTNNKLTHSDRVMDVWHWKAARVNPIGIIHDKSHIVSTTRPMGKSAQHYDVGGKEVFVARPGDGGVSPYKSNKVDPFTYKEDRVPGYIPTRPDNADATDVDAKGVWKDGAWTVEIGRKMDTGHHETDTVFDPAKGSKMAIGVFDHAGDHFHAVSGVVDIKFE